MPSSLAGFRFFRELVVLCGFAAAVAVTVPASARQVQAIRPSSGLSPMGEFSGVSCYAYNRCVAVGSFRPNERASDRQLAEAWDGQTSSWMRLATPTGHYASYLNGAGCVTSFCILVGEWTIKNPDGGGQFTPVAERWNKGGAIVDTHPASPQGTKYANLNSVSCLSQTFCMATGVETGPNGAGPYTEEYNGQAWTLLPTPHAAGRSGLSDVTCVPKRFQPSSWCHAVGTYSTSGGNVRPWALSWDGTKWSREQVQNPSGADRVFLNSVSCRMVQCLAVGYSATNHQKVPISEKLSLHGGGPSGSGSHVWLLERNVPKPGLGSAIFSGVSWAGPNLAKGAGTYYDVKRKHWLTLIENWQDKWRLNNPAVCSHRCRTRVPNSSLPNSRLASVSCSAYNACMAVGVAVGEVRDSYVNRPMALWLKHTAGYYWNLAPSPPLG